MRALLFWDTTLGGSEGYFGECSTPGVTYVSYECFRILTKGRNAPAAVGAAEYGEVSRRNVTMRMRPIHLRLRQG
jgi:hypothetical protein